MKEELQKRISAALDRAAALEGAHSDRELAALIEGSPEAAAYARDLARLGGALRDWPLPEPTDEAMEALALRIEQRLGDELPRIADPTQPPTFDDDDELRDATAGLLGGPGVSSGEFDLVERLSLSDASLPEVTIPNAVLPAGAAPAKPASVPPPPPPGAIAGAKKPTSVPPPAPAPAIAAEAGEPPATRALPKLATVAEIKKAHDDPDRISFPSISVPSGEIPKITPIDRKKEPRPMGWLAGLAAAAAVGLGIFATTSMYSGGEIPSPSSLASSAEPAPPALLPAQPLEQAPLEQAALEEAVEGELPAAPAAAAEAPPPPPAVTATAAPVAAPTTPALATPTLAPAPMQPYASAASGTRGPTAPVRAQASGPADLDSPVAGAQRLDRLTARGGGTGTSGGGTSGGGTSGGGTFGGGTFGGGTSGGGTSAGLAAARPGGSATSAASSGAPAAHGVGAASGEGAAMGGAGGTAGEGAREPRRRTAADPEASPATETVAAPEPRREAPTARAAASAEPARDLPAVPERGAVLSALQAVEPAVRACATDTHGTAPVRIVVASSGRVTTATVGGAVAGTLVGSCVARAVRTARFPPFSSERFEITYPFTL